MQVMSSEVAQVAPNLSKYFEALEKYVAHSEKYHQQAAAAAGEQKIALFGFFSGGSKHCDNCIARTRPRSFFHSFARSPDDPRARPSFHTLRAYVPACARVRGCNAWEMLGAQLCPSIAHDILNIARKS